MRQERSRRSLHELCVQVVLIITLFDHSIFSTRASRIGRHANLKVHASGTATRKTMLFDYDYKLSLPRISVKMMHVRPYRQYAKVPLNGAHMGQAH